MITDSDEFGDPRAPRPAAGEGKAPKGLRPRIFPLHLFGHLGQIGTGGRTRSVTPPRAGYYRKLTTERDINPKEHSP